MHISKIFSQANKPVISFEIFPPKRKPNQSQADLNSLLRTIDQLANLKPDFISVTYGAGGTSSEGSLEVSEYVKQKGVIPLPHFTAIGYPVEDIHAYIHQLWEKGFKNVLALRGDLPPSPSKADLVWKDFLHATDLIKIITRDYPDMCIGGAAYPETHQESVYEGQDIDIMKMKEQLGVEFFLTQLFFDNDIFFRFMDQARNKGVTAPVSAGVMPLTSPKFIDKIIELSGAHIPEELAEIINRWRDNEEEFKKRTLDYAVRQINDLCTRGAEGIHLYTMNRWTTAKNILKEAKIH